MEVLDGYSLGSLSRNEARRVRAHLGRCGICRAELARWEALVAKLGDAASAGESDPGLEERILSRLPSSGTAGFFFKPAIAPAVLGGVLVAVCALFIAGLLLFRGSSRGAAPPGVVSSVVNLLGTGSAPTARGMIVYEDNSRTGALTAFGLQVLAPGFQYQLWMVKDGERISGGVFSVDLSGSGFLAIFAPYPLSECHAFGVTVEPKGGSPEPSGLKVLDVIL
jgi:anti-sigma-K factor RskA